MPLLEMHEFCLEFKVGDHWLRAVDDFSLTVHSGETVCLVGESGCGKSVTAMSIARLLPEPPARSPGGRILLEGRDVLQMSAAELRRIRGGVVSYVFQEPSASLNPVLRIGAQVLEMLQAHRPENATKQEVLRLLDLVGIPAPEERYRAYPFELSGGMQQRVMIAMALASQPKLLVADEPTTALDATIQAQLLQLLRDLNQRFSMAILLITHNLGIVAEMASRVAVMYAGEIVELGPADAVLRDARHPYTKALLASTPTLDRATVRLQAIPGNVPTLSNYARGCRFAPRCPTARPECAENRQSLREVAPGRFVRCAYEI